MFIEASIDFGLHKGCYVGDEVESRVRVSDLQFTYDTLLIGVNTDVMCQMMMVKAF